MEVPVIECDLTEDKAEGFYYLGCIYIHNRLTDFEKYGVLAEEYGHYRTSMGDILSEKNIFNDKQEKKARTYAYELVTPISKIISCMDACCTNYFECAQHLGISEEFLLESLAYYSVKLSGYSLSYKGKNIIFDSSSVYVIDPEQIA